MDDREFADDVYYTRMGICGCVSPGAADVLHKVMQQLAAWRSDLNRPDHGRVFRDQIETLIGGRPDDGASAFVMVALDRADLIEHGGNIGGSWLTADGERFLAWMDKHGSDPAGWPDE